MFEFVGVKFRDILDLPSLHIQTEKITTLVGVSGSGKTTILRLLNKMLSPTEGRILMGESDLAQVDSVAHRRQVTMLGQAPVLFEGTVRDNLNMGLRFQDKKLADDRQLAAMLEQVKLAKSLDSSPHNLSGGEKQRLALARVLLVDSPVILLDEPSSALDEQTGESVIQMVAEHVKQRHKTLVMVTHSPTIAQRYSDCIIEIAGGRQVPARGEKL